MRSGHCWLGSSMAAIAARTWAATAPTLLVWEARAVRTSCFTFALYSSGVFCHLRAASFARACSCNKSKGDQPHDGHNEEYSYYGNTYTSSESILESETCGVSEMGRGGLIDELRGE